jgi:hypothetical protein
MKKNSDMPAFQPSMTGMTEFHYGLTKREYFAVMAMQGSLASRTVPLNHINKELFIEISIQFADELLKQLEE